MELEPYGMWSFRTGFFHLTDRHLGPSLSLHGLRAHYFLVLNNTPKSQWLHLLSLPLNEGRLGWGFSER